MIGLPGPWIYTDFPLVPIDIPSGFKAMVAADVPCQAIALNLEQPHRAHDVSEVCASLFHDEDLRVVTVEASPKSEIKCVCVGMVVDQYNLALLFQYQYKKKLTAQGGEGRLAVPPEQNQSAGDVLRVALLRPHANDRGDEESEAG